MTQTIRDHLNKRHYDEWAMEVIANELKDFENVKTSLSDVSGYQPRTVNAPKEPFTLDGFYSRLMRWVVSDDQVFCSYF